MAKLRTPIPEDVAASVEFDHDRICCICHQRGQPTQIHHIDDDPSNHAPENLAILCLACHDQTQIRGGFARKLRPELVRRYRDDWVKAVSRSRSVADELLAAKASGLSVAEKSFSDPNWPELAQYLDTLPELLVAAVNSVKADWDSGVTQKMVEASVEVGSILERIWVRLASFYGQDAFNGDPASHLAAHLDEQLRWYRYLIEPDGPGTGGTIVRVMIGNEAVAAAARAVEETALALLGLAVNADQADHWVARWRSAVAKSGNG